MIGVLSEVMTDDANFESAKVFNPDRWLKNPSLEKGKTFVPFGVGPRICVGRQLAEYEARLIVGSFFQRYQVLLHGTEPIAYEDGACSRKPTGWFLT
jgi:cytochrome P450